MTSSTAAGPPAVLTASRIWGYRISSPTARVVNPEAAGTNGDQVLEFVLRCPDGRCPAITGQAGLPAFTAAAGRVFTRTATNRRSSPCDPLVFTTDLVRGADGSYRGTSSVIPGATEATWNGGISRCTSYSVERSYTLSPLVEQDPAPAGTPVALDPARITGYRYPQAPETGAEYLPTCTAGWCTLQCPLDGCTATLAFPAAPTRFTIPAVAVTTADCGTGTAKFVVERGPNGVVVFTIARTTSTATQVCRRPLYLQATPVTR